MNDISLLIWIVQFVDENSVDPCQLKPAYLDLLSFQKRVEDFEKKLCAQYSYLVK